MTAQRSLPLSATPAVLRAHGIPISFALLIGAWLFDFQSEGAGQGLALQGIFLSTYLFALIAFLLGDRARGRAMTGIGIFLPAGLLFLVVGILSGILHGQEFYPILRNAISVIVYVSATFATARAMVSIDLRALRKFLGIACLGYALSSLVIYNAMSGGIDLSVVRFQIVGTSSIAALAYISLSLLFRLSFVELVTLAANGLILLVSITRTYLFAFVAQALVPIMNFRRLFGGRMLLVGLAAIIVFIGLLTFGQGQLDRWQDRVVSNDSNYSEYQTYYTRLSEWDYMYSSWTGSPREFLIGSGFAAETTYFYTSDAGGASEHMVGFGHNQYLSEVFTAGTVGGLPLLLVQLVQGFFALQLVHRLIRRPDLRSDAVFLSAWGALIVLGTLSANMFLNTYSQRGLALWYGIGTGLLMAARSRRSLPPQAMASSGAPLARSRSGVNGN